MKTFKGTKGNYSQAELDHFAYEDSLFDHMYDDDLINQLKH